MVIGQRQAHSVSAVGRVHAALFHRLLALNLHLARARKVITRRRKIRIQRVILRQFNVEPLEPRLRLEPQLSAQVDVRLLLRRPLRHVQATRRQLELTQAIEHASPKAITVDNDLDRALTRRQRIVFRLHGARELHQIEISPDRQRMDHWPLPLAQHAAVISLPCDVQAPNRRRVIINPDLVVHRVLDQRHRHHRVLLTRGKVAKYAHMIRGAVLAVALLHVLNEILADARARDAGNVHRVPVLAQPIVRVVKEARVPRRVARKHRRGGMARHRARRSLEDRVGHARRLVGNQEHVLAVNTRQRLRLLRTRRPARNKRALRLALQLNAVTLNLEQIVERGLEPLGHVFHLRETRVKQLRGRGGRDNGLTRHAHQHMPNRRHRDGRRLAHSMARTNGYASLRWRCDRVQELRLPLVRLDADDLASKANGVTVVAAHQRKERVIIFFGGHVNTPLKGARGV